MRESFGSARAICTFLFLLALFEASSSARAGTSANIARYRSARVSAGAKTLPVLARLSYKAALAELHDGEVEAAEKQLLAATEYDPQYADPYFTLAQLKFRQFDPEGAILLMQAFIALSNDFSMQSLFLLNAIVAVPYILILVTLIVCLALAIKYLPFAAHRLTELLKTRFHAVLPNFSGYLLLLLPLVIIPGTVTALSYLTVVCWLFMYRRERFLMLVLFAPFIFIGIFGSYLRPVTMVADPTSMTSLIARANVADGDSRLIKAIERTPATGLESEKNMTLGLLHQRRGQYSTASDYFFRAISLAPDDAMGYINLGNVYFLQRDYEKALEGYRKAEGIGPLDAICQHGLAQAYIKTLLMKEASKSLQLAASLGLEKVKSSYATATIDSVRVFPKTFSNARLWQLAIVEGSSSSKDILDELLLPFTRFPREVSAWILLAALMVAFILAATIDPSKLTFQCSNCGRLTCKNCCNTEREMHLCQECAHVVEGVTSEKVTDALLRQKRQHVVVNRRRLSRFVTTLLPGMRDISFGRITRGFYLAALFSFGVVHVLTKGFIVKDTASFVTDVPLWKMIIPVAAIVLSYMMSVFSKPQYSFRAYRPPRKQGSKEIKTDIGGGARAA